MTAPKPGRETNPAAFHSSRLDALWRISTATGLSDEDMTRALLTLAAARMRPGMLFAAHLHRVAGDELIVEEIVSRAGAALRLPARGSACTLDASPLLEVVRRRASHACADVHAMPQLADRAGVRGTGMRSFVGTAFRAGGTVFALAVTSAQPLDGAFTDDDAHFLETIASLLELRVERQLARARIHIRAQREALASR
jgi:GAF domain-containing protein